MKTLVTTASVFVITAVSIGSFITPTVFGKEQDTTKANPASAESVTARVDKLFAEWNRSDSPGCSLGVSQNGVPVYPCWYTGTPFWLTPRLQPGESDLFHSANNLSTLAVTDSADAGLALVVSCSFPKTVGVMKEPIATAVMTKTLAVVTSVFMIVPSLNPGTKVVWLTHRRPNCLTPYVNNGCSLTCRRRRHNHLVGATN